MPIDLTSPAFQDGAYIPMKYTLQGENVSPPLQWENIPAGTRSIALLLDGDHGNDGPQVHWILFDLPRQFRGLDEDVAAKDILPPEPKPGIHAKQGRNAFGKIGYTGPVPQRDRAHRYTFTLYALDAILHLGAGANKTALLGSMQGHVLDRGVLSCQWSE